MHESSSVVSMILAGVAMTLTLTIIAIVVGSILAVAVALARGSSNRVLRSTTALVISTVLAVPLLVQLFLLYYAVPTLTGNNVSEFTTVVVTLTINQTVQMAEIYRAGLQSVDINQHRAATMLGLSRMQTFVHVVAPQALRLVLPALGSTAIMLLKGSSLATFIGVGDLLNVGQTLAVRTFEPVFYLTAVAGIYFLLTYPIVRVVARLETRSRIGAARPVGPRAAPTAPAGAQR